jgi:hypothetical protein
MAWAGSETTPGPLIFRGCDLTVECLPATEEVRAQLSATAPISQGCASARGRVSKTQLTPGSTEAACQFKWGRGRQVMHLPCKQAHMGAVPIDSTISPRGTRLKHRAKPHKLRQAGVIPAPATNFGRCSGCRSVKPVSQITVGSDDWSITSTSHHFFGSVAQLAEQPVVCGKAEGANPFGSAIYRSVAQSSERPAWDREVAGENPAVPTILKCCRGRIIRHPPSKRNDAGGIPAGSANESLPGGVKVARRFVKPHGVGASPTLAANFRV